MKLHSYCIRNEANSLSSLTEASGSWKYNGAYGATIASSCAYIASQQYQLFSNKKLCITPSQ